MLIDGCESRFWDAFVDKLLPVDVSHGVHILDDGVHERLGERRLVQLIMAHFTISNEIDHNISREFLAVLGGNAESVRDIVHRVRVDVEDGGADRRGDLRAVNARPGPVRSRSKADLVIDDNMDGSSNSIVLK